MLLTAAFCIWKRCLGAAVDLVNFRYDDQLNVSGV